jgi:hypothetical protein
MDEQQQQSAEQASGSEQKVLTVDSHGNICGDTSHIDPHILEQLTTPEARAQIRQMYKDHRGSSSGGRRELKKQMPVPRYLADASAGERRDLRGSVPAGMSKSEAKRLRRKWTKAAIKQQHGRTA